MKRYIPVTRADAYIDKTPMSEEMKEKEDFHERWVSKFGEPKYMTMRADQFLERLKEMRDFE